MSEIFLKIVNMSIAASWVALAVLLLRLCLRRAPKWTRVLLWGVVAVRLMLPFSVESVLSLIPSAQTVSPTIMMEQTPTVQTGVRVLNRVINPVIGNSLAPAPGDSANPLQILIPVMAAVWVAGVAALLLYSAVSYVRLRRRVREAVILRENIYRSERVDSPFVLGVFRPGIYLPYGMDDRHMAHVIAHEQTHIRRRDHLWKPLGFLLLTIHWFNPLMWLSYILLCRDIELACDEQVIRRLDNPQRADYTQALVACSIDRHRIAACPLAFGEVGVKERVKSVLNYKKPAFWVVLLSAVACVAVAVCFLTNPVRDKNPDKNGYYLLIGEGGVRSVEVSLPDSSGCLICADGSAFARGEKVSLGLLWKVTDLRGLTIVARGTDNEVIYKLAVPEDATADEVASIVESSDWLFAPVGWNLLSSADGENYTYEGEGAGGNFSITLYDDGTFSYYEGWLSSYVGTGTWQFYDGIVTLIDKEIYGLTRINHFYYDGESLRFIAQGSNNFLYVHVQDGERFDRAGR